MLVTIAALQVSGSYDEITSTDLDSKLLLRPGASKAMMCPN